MRRFYAFMCLQNTKRPTTCFSTVIYSRDHQNMSYKHYCCICTELHPADHHPLNDLFPQRVKADQNPAGLTGRTNKNLHHRHRVSVLQQPGGTSCCHSCYVALGYYISTFFFYHSSSLNADGCDLISVPAGDSEHAGVRQQSQEHHEQT